MEQELALYWLGAADSSVPEGVTLRLQQNPLRMLRLKIGGPTVKNSRYCYNASRRGPPNMKDLTNPAWIKTKGILFLFLGVLSVSLLFFERPTLRVAALLLVAVWSFCRFYYFAFYVLERYVDPTYRFSGLFSLGRYLLRKPRQKP